MVEAPRALTRRCKYDWQDASDIFDIEVNSYGSLAGHTLEAKVKGYIERVDETGGTGVANTGKTKVTYSPIASGIQHEQPYLEVIGRSEGRAYLNTCNTLFISRFFALGDWDDDIIQVSTTVCERDWERERIHDEIMGILDSFRPVPYGEQS